MEKWFIRNRKANYALIAQQFGISEVTARIAVNRGISSNEELKAYLHPSLNDLHEPRTMKHMEKAANIIKKKIAEGKKIRIIGDYDVDGVMSTYILYTGLQKCGADVDYEIPDRIKDGYGINVMIVEAAARDQIDTIVTCDNGIAAYDQIARAKELGLTVVVTDHHDIPFQEEDGEKVYRIPPADAIVNPKQHDCSYPMEGICGAVVAFKLIQVLYDLCGIEKEAIEELLEFAAIATVCDVMDLTDENRTIVQYGLRKAELTKNIGLRALIRENKLEDQHLSAYHFGFVVGPCINASGRLESAKLLTDGEEHAKGSGRSIDEYPMFDKLNECKELLLKFGGHPLAAGLSLKKENIDLLREKLNEKAGLTEDDFIPKVSFDMVLPFEQVTYSLLQEFELLEPFGKSNEKPSFALRDVQLINAKVIGKNKNMARLTVKTQNSNRIFTAMLFREFETFEELIRTKYGGEALVRLYEGTAENVYLDMIFYPNVNEFNGNTTIQFVIQHFR